MENNYIAKSMNVYKNVILCKSNSFGRILLNKMHKLKAKLQLRRVLHIY